MRLTSNTFTVVFMPAPLPTTISAFPSRPVDERSVCQRGASHVGRGNHRAADKRRWEREEIPVGMRRIERGHPADKHSSGTPSPRQAPNWEP